MVKNLCNVIIQTCFKGKFLFLLISILCLLIFVPVFKGFAGLSILTNIIFTTTLISGAYAVSKRKHVPLTAIFLATPFFASLWTGMFLKIPSLVLVGECFGILFTGFIVITILSFIFREKEVTSNVIYGAIVVYLLIAIMWAFIYSLLEIIQPGSFAIREGQVGVDRHLFIYYSLVTITTLGYGDITPLTAQANSFSSLEAVIGQIYLVVTVARLVGINIAQSMDRKSG
jgi:voltage-gated potassium channel